MRMPLTGGVRVEQGRKGQTLVRQGDVLSSAFFLLDGILRVYTLTEDGREATLYRLREGQVCVLSLNAAFTHGRYPAWVAVESPTARYALLPAKALRAAFAKETETQDLVLQSLTSAIQDLLGNLDEVLTLRLSERIERFVSRNADADGRLAMTHEVLASHLGVAREVVSREIASLKKSSKLQSGRGYLQLPHSPGRT